MMWLVSSKAFFAGGISASEANASLHNPVAMRKLISSLHHQPKLADQDVKAVAAIHWDVDVPVNLISADVTERINDMEAKFAHYCTVFNEMLNFKHEIKYHHSESLTLSSALIVRQNDDI